GPAVRASEAVPSTGTGDRDLEGGFVPDMAAPIKLGANCWNQYSGFDGWLNAIRRADGLGYDSLWTWDHVYPIVGSWQGPMLEAYTAISAAAARTARGTIGLLVGANTFRNPAL